MHYGTGFTRLRHHAEAVRRAIQNSQESLRALAKRYGINQKTVTKWKQRDTVADRSTDPKEARSTILSIEEEAIIVAFRRHTLLPLDDCLYALQPTIPHLTRSSLHRGLQRHGISRLPEVAGDKPSKKRFKAYPLGYFHIDQSIAERKSAVVGAVVGPDRDCDPAAVLGVAAAAAACGCCADGRAGRQTAGSGCTGPPGASADRGGRWPRRRCRGVPRPDDSEGRSPAPG